MSIIQVEDVSMRFNLAQEKTRDPQGIHRQAAEASAVFQRILRTAGHFVSKLSPASRWRWIGRNGSGKSTMLKLIAGVMYPTTGSVTVNGEIAPLIELGAGFDLDLTAREERLSERCGARP